MLSASQHGAFESAELMKTMLVVHVRIGSGKGRKTLILLNRMVCRDLNVLLIYSFSCIVGWFGGLFGKKHVPEMISPART